MKTKLENNTLTLFLSGRIDASNAEQTEKEIFSALNANPEAKTLVLDFESLDYISSAGLRILMKLKKLNVKPFALANVSRDVYEILETTGFTEILTIKRAFRKISVEGCEEIGSGGYGTVYRIDEETIVKVYNRGSLELIEHERLLSQRAFLNGLPTAIAYDTVKVGEKYGNIYELISAKSAAKLITADPSSLESVVRKVAAGLREFHKIEINDPLFEDKKNLFYQTIELAAPYLTEEEKPILKDFLDSIPSAKTFLHGDYNYKNVMLRGDEILLIDIGDAGIGNPNIDVAGVLLSATFPLHAPLPKEEIRRLLGYNPEYCQQTWNYFCSEYYQTNDKKEIERYTKKLLPLTYFNLAYHSLRICDPNDKASMQKRVDMHIHEKFLPALEEAKKLD